MSKLGICEVYFLFTCTVEKCYFLNCFFRQIVIFFCLREPISCVASNGIFAKNLIRKLGIWVSFPLMNEDSHIKPALCESNFQQNLIWSSILNPFMNEKSLISENKGDESFDCKDYKRRILFKSILVKLK